MAQLEQQQRGDPSSGSASKPSLHQSLLSFCDYTTAHGLGRLGAQGGGIGRSAWLCFLLATYCGFCYHMYTLTAQFISVPLATSLTTTLPFELPDLYFCPSDIATMSKLSRQIDSDSIMRNSSCNAKCKMGQLKFDIDSVLYDGGAKFGDAALALSEALAASEETLVQKLLFGNATSSITCRTTLSGEEYTGNLSMAPVYSDSLMESVLDPPATVSAVKPYVSHVTCIGWNEAARELKSAGATALGDKILGMNFSDLETSCRQPAGLPLTEFHSVATRPLRSYVGCFPSSVVSVYVQHSCLSDSLSQLTLETCAECCYRRNFTLMGAYSSSCVCGQLPGSTDLASLLSDEYNCIDPCPGNESQVCGGFDLAASVYLVRSRDPKPLNLPFRSSIASFNSGPYCFYREAGTGLLAATYCNVPYCTMPQTEFDCVRSNSRNEIIGGIELSRYTGRLTVARPKVCQPWGLVPRRLLAGDWRLQFDPADFGSVTMPRVVSVAIETADYALQSDSGGDAYCRSARVVLDVTHGRPNGSTFYRRFVAVTPENPVCPVVANGILVFENCVLIKACHTTVRSITGVIRDRVSSALLAREFGSDIGTGLVSCSVGETGCTAKDFLTLAHPEFGLCHRLSSQRMAQLIESNRKASDVRVSVSYFTDSTDSMGRWFTNLTKLASAVFPGLDFNPADTAEIAMKVVVTPRGRYPRLADAVSVSPGRHVELKLGFGASSTYPKPPERDCRRDRQEVTYAMLSWSSSARLAVHNVNMTSLWGAKSWPEKLDALHEILLALNRQREAEVGPMNTSLHFDTATQEDCINWHKVNYFVTACSCLPAFLPVPAEFAATPRCFNRSDPAGLASAEACHAAEAARMLQYEKLARRLCPPPCDTRSYAVRQAAFPWPGLTRENSLALLKFLALQLGYPSNAMNSRGVADVFSAYLWARRLAKLPASKRDPNDLLDFQYGLDMLERRLAKVTLQAASEFGERTTEEPSYTLKDLMADMGGALGLWSGVSVLTVCEIIELVAYLISAAAMKQQQQQQQQLEASRGQARIRPGSRTSSKVLPVAASAVELTQSADGAAAVPGD